MGYLKFFCVNILIPSILAFIMANLGIVGCKFWGDFIVQAPCWLINFLVFGVVIALVLDLIVYIIWPKWQWEKPRLDLIPSAGHVVIIDRPRHQGARLEIVNREELEITHCYATLVELCYRPWDWKLGMRRGIPSLLCQPDRIKWAELLDSNDSCEIKIPARDSRHIDLADTLDGLGVNLRAGRFVFREGPDEDNIPAYTVTIRVDGKINDKSMKPRRFDGYLYYEVEKRSTIIKQQTQDGSFVEEIKEWDTIPLLKFEKGDWMKSKKIRKILGVEDTKCRSNKKKEPLTREGFFKVLRKISRPKDVKSAEEKSKTSE